MDTKYDALKIGNQLCFPLYACSREIIKRYKPFLDEIDLTYTQYIAMMVLWEQGSTTVKELGNALYLDSGTLTPLLKKSDRQPDRGGRGAERQGAVRAPPDGQLRLPGAGRGPGALPHSLQASEISQTRFWLSRKRV